MEQVRLGASGLKVSRICLGCMSFGGAGGPTHPWAMDEDAARPFFRRAIEAGITFFDTANAYNHGASEEVTGRALKEYARREEVVIATKVGLAMGEGPMMRGLSRTSRDVPPFCIMDETHTVKSLNLVGLRRNGFDAKRVRALKNAFLILFQSGLNMQNALEQIGVIARSPEIYHWMVRELTAEPEPVSDDLRTRAIRHRLTRRLLDDPVVYYDELAKTEGPDEGSPLRICEPPRHSPLVHPIDDRLPAPARENRHHAHDVTIPALVGTEARKFQLRKRGDHPLLPEAAAQFPAQVPRLHGRLLVEGQRLLHGHVNLLPFAGGETVV